MPELEVVGEAGDGRQALEVVKRTRPDIVLLDVNMPEMGGVRPLKRFKFLITPEWSC